jgi:hypothetical protein
MFGIIHSWDMENHHIHFLYFSISMWVEGSWFGHIGFHHRPYDGLKGAQEPTFMIEDNSMWYPKMNPNTFEGDLNSGLGGDTLLVGCQDGHLRKPINDHNYTMITTFGRR